MINLYIALTLYASLAAVAGAALWGYLQLSKEIALLKRRIAPAAAPVRSAAPESAPKPARATSQDARAQILRLDRQGENTPSIAAATGVPQAEVELTLKLDRMRSARA